MSSAEYQRSVNCIPVFYCYGEFFEGNSLPCENNASVMTQLYVRK